MTKSTCRLTLLFVLVFVVLLPTSTAYAANFTAANAAELINAINTANGNGQFDTITLTANITLNAVNNTTEGPNGLPVISSDMRIFGDGHTITRGGGTLRFLYVDSSGDLTLDDVTLDNGRVTGGTGTVEGRGGALYNDGGTVTILNSTFSNNVTANYEGGAINNTNGGTMTISGTLFTGNRAGDGAACIRIDSSGTTLTISGITVENNEAEWGSFIEVNTSSTVEISNSVFSNNRTTDTGSYGGVFSTGGNLTIVNSTIADNTGAANGGAFEVYGGTTTLIHTTVANNSATNGANIYRSGGTIYLESSIIADPVTGENYSGASNRLIDNGNNIEGESSGSYTCGLSDPTSLSVLDAGLNPLVNDGGPTETMPLEATSPAVNGTGATCNDPPVNGRDQRGSTRDGKCDIGAYELRDQFISGYVWYDTDGDGIRDAGETNGAGGVTATINPGGTSVLTDSDGYYIFDGISTGTYTVTFSNLPAGYGFSAQNQGTDDNVDSDPDPATGTTDGIPIGNPGVETHWDAGLTIGDLAVSKSNSVGGTTIRGAPWDWTLHANNVGAGGVTFAAGDVILTDELPAGPTYPAAATVTLNNATGTVNCPIAGNTVTCTAMTAVTIGYAGSVEAEISRITSSVVADYTNPDGVCSVDPNDELSESDETNNDCNSDMVSVLIGPQPDIQVTKANSVGGSTVTGSPWDWALYVNNTGLGDATFAPGDVILRDELPAGLTYPAAATVTPNAGASGTINCSIAADVLTCTAQTAVVIDSATPGSIAVTIPGITAAAVGTYTNPDGACSGDPNGVVEESDEANNTCSSDTVTVLAAPLPDLEVTKSNSVGGNTTAGVPWDWNLYISNVGTVDASFGIGDVVLTDELPAGPTYPAAAAVTMNTGSTGTLNCPIAGNVLTCTAMTAVTLDAVTPGSIDVEISNITATAEISYDNPPTGSTCAVDPNGAVAEDDETNNDCNTDTVTIPVVTLPDMQVTKENIVGTDSWRWVLNVENGGILDATFNAGDVILVDELPSGPSYLVVNVTPNAGVTGDIDCTVVGYDLTCTAATNVTIDFATPGGFEVSIPGLTADPGEYINPRTGGTCTVDPGDVIAEIDETDNDCNEVIVAVFDRETIVSVERKVRSGCTDCGTTTVTESGPEYIIKTIDNPSATGGDTVTYTITVHNPKDIPLTQCMVYDVFDALLTNIEVVSTSHGVFDLRNNTLMVSGFTLQPGETATIVVTAVVSDDYRAGDMIPNVAVFESPDASIHISDLVLIGGMASQNDGDSASLMIMPGELPATGDEPVRHGWIYASVGVVLLIGIGLIVRRRLLNRAA